MFFLVHKGQVWQHKTEDNLNVSHRNPKPENLKGSYWFITNATEMQDNLLAAKEPSN